MTEELNNIVGTEVQKTQSTENPQNTETDINQEQEVHPPVDGSFSVVTSNNLSEATLSVTQPQYGGKTVSESDVRQELTKQKICYGIDDNAIKQIIENGPYDTPRRIAFWTPPEDGVNGTIKYLFEKNVEIKPKEDENGFVDYRDLGIIRNITQGTIIAEITLPTTGEPGTNIRNEKVMQKIGVAANTAHGEGIGLSGTGEQLIALTDGNLKYSNNKFSIETVFNMKGDVDVSTGNIDFIGDIIIKGEVKEGFKVISKKSITIFENATNAIIEAGGNVVIKKGCIGTKISAKGNVTLSFVENSKIKCDGSLKGDAFITCDVECGGELTATGSKGFLMGGKYTSLKSLYANSIGTKSYGSTIVTVGDNAVMLEERADCEKKLKDLEQQIINCTQIVDFLTVKKKEIGSIPPERESLLNKSVKQKIMLHIDIGKIEARIKEIDKYIENRQNLSVTCKKHLYPGTKITINDFVMQVNDLYQYCKISLDQDGIKVETL